MKTKLSYRGLSLHFSKPNKKVLSKINNQLQDLVKVRKAIRSLNALGTLHKENQARLDLIKKHAGEGIRLIRSELQSDVADTFTLTYDRKPLFYREKTEKDDPNDPDSYYIEYKYTKAAITLDIKVSSGYNHIQAIKEAASQIQENIRDARSHMRTPDVDDDVVSYANSNFTVTKVGGVHLEPETWSNVFQTKNYQKCFDKKVPDNKNIKPHVGVEIEFYCKIDRDNLAREFAKEKLQNYVNITTDGSLKSPPEDAPIAHELRIMAEEKDIESVIKRVCKVITSDKVGGKVNKTCGVHVHLDMRQITRNKELIFNNLVNCQGLLFSLVPKSRRSNKYCNFVATSNYQESNGNHHDAISGRDAYAKHKTFEVRIHSGTINASKINHWINLLLLITNNTNMMAPITGLTEFEKALTVPLSEELKSYIQKRVEEVNTSEE